MFNLLMGTNANSIVVMTHVCPGEAYTLCTVCGKDFAPTNARQRFCSGTCRHKKYRDESQAYKALIARQGARKIVAGEEAPPAELVQVRHVIPITREDADLSERVSERVYAPLVGSLPGRGYFLPASRRRRDGR
jgi:hypothetical protein